MGTTEKRRSCAARLEAAASRVSQLESFVGMDGFVDEIFHVVDKRETAESYKRLRTIKDYADRLAQAAGKSTNIELVSQLVKLGGNGPIMANALAAFGFKAHYLGCVGYPNLHPIFGEFAQCATVHSIANAALTDALEFEDGKVMVGKHQALREVNWQNITDRFGIQKLKDRMAAADLISFVNWTMLTAMSEIWEAILRDIAPGLNDRRRRLFFDLADPEKRTHGDILQALNLVSRFQDTFDVILGLNEKESSEIAQVLGLSIAEHSKDGLARLASEIRERLRLDTVVIHPVSYAVAADASGTAAADGPFTSQPRITTGAGDHFNAGYCLGRTLGLSNEDSLLIGVATSGFYVRNAQSPSVPGVLGLLRGWPETEIESTMQSTK